MRRTGILAGLLVTIGVAAIVTTTHVTARGSSQALGVGEGPREVVLRDDCDPTDPGWIPTGGQHTPHP